MQLGKASGWFSPRERGHHCAARTKGGRSTLYTAIRRALAATCHSPDPKRGSGSLLPLSKVSPIPFFTQGTSARLRCPKLGSASNFSRASVRNPTKMGQSTLTVRFPLRCLQDELLPAIMILLNLVARPSPNELAEVGEGSKLSFGGQRKCVVRLKLLTCLCA